MIFICRHTSISSHISMYCHMYSYWFIGEVISNVFARVYANEIHQLWVFIWRGSSCSFVVTFCRTFHIPPFSLCFIKGMCLFIHLRQPPKIFFTNSALKFMLWSGISFTALREIKCLLQIAESSPPQSALCSHVGFAIFFLEKLRAFSIIEEDHGRTTSNLCVWKTTNEIRFVYT